VNNRFRYRAATTEGRVVEGVLQATSQRSVLDELRRQRLYPVAVEPLHDAVRVLPRRGRTGRTQALALFIRTVATLLHAGVPLDRALAFGAAQARHDAVAAAARHVRQRVQAGAPLADAMAERPAVFGALVPAMTVAGEESGALDEALARLADHLDAAVELRAQLRSALLYPALIAVTSGLAILVLLAFVVPRLIGILHVDGVPLPLSTRMLVAASDVFVTGWWILLLVAGTSLVFFRRWLAHPHNLRRWHAWRLAWPLLGELELKYATARFARAFGMLLGSGRPILPALRTARSTVTNAAIGFALDRSTLELGQGRRLHESLADTFPPLATELIAVGEESGRLDTLCLQIADTYDAEVRRALTAAVAIVEPALILIFGLIVGFVALAMLQAIYGVNQTFL